MKKSPMIMMLILSLGSGAVAGQLDAEIYARDVLGTAALKSRSDDLLSPPRTAIPEELKCASFALMALTRAAKIPYSYAFRGMRKLRKIKVEVLSFAETWGHTRVGDVDTMIFYENSLEGRPVAISADLTTVTLTSFVDPVMKVECGAMDPDKLVPPIEEAFEQVIRPLEASSGKTTKEDAQIQTDALLRELEELGGH